MQNPFENPFLPQETQTPQENTKEPLPDSENDSPPPTLPECTDEISIPPPPELGDFEDGDEDRWFEPEYDEDGEEEWFESEDPGCEDEDSLVWEDALDEDAETLPVEGESEEDDSPLYHWYYLSEADDWIAITGDETMSGNVPGFPVIYWSDYPDYTESWLPLFLMSDEIIADLKGETGPSSEDNPFLV